MPDIALITSTYRAAAFLPAYHQNVVRLAQAFQAAHRQLELVIVANEPTPEEIDLLAGLETLVMPSLQVQVIQVARESIYASWNRGVALSSAPTLSFWGVDDQRTPEALLAGFDTLQTGADVTWFPYQVITTVHWRFFQTHNTATFEARPRETEAFRRRMWQGPFWMTTRTFFDTIGDFDPKFRVCGDFEWMQRALNHGRMQPTDVPGGSFIIHGKNLSANTNPLKIVEDNIIFLRNHLLAQLKPADPDLMRRCWEDWGAQGQVLDADTQAFLWGVGAFERQQRWLRDWQARQQRESVVRLPRQIMEALGLRPLMARMGIVKSS